VLHDNELSPYLQALEATDQFSGVALGDQGDASLFAGAYGYAYGKFMS
jgi:hypothetical protein